MRSADSAGVAARGVDGSDRDGDKFIGFLHEQFQFRGLHEFGLDQEFQLGFMCSVFLGAVLAPVLRQHFPVSIRIPQSTIRDGMSPHSAIRNGPRLKICPI
jgi:hypothetical protein